MYKLLKIQEYEMTRDLILENLDNQQVLTVFDDTDLASDKLEFMRVGEIYDCKIFLFARSKSAAEVHQRTPEKFTVLGKEKIGQAECLKIQDKHGNILYVSSNFASEVENGSIHLIPLRYDILQVNNVVR